MRKCVLEILKDDEKKKLVMNDDENEFKIEMSCDSVYPYKMLPNDT